MLTIAVTGGVACGKSSACRKLLARLPTGRVGHFDCDAAVAGLLREESALSAIRRIEGVGPAFTGPGGLDKTVLRDLVFENPGIRGRLETVLHPLVLERVAAVSEEFDSAVALFLVEVPLLYESAFPLARSLDLVVGASQDTQMHRLVRDREMDEGLAEAVIRSQMPVAEKIDRGDVVIWNDGLREPFEKQIEHLAARCASLF